MATLLFDPSREFLDSWKEIAVFLRRGVRTVQRWEQTENLPIRRHQHAKRGSVYAVPSELTHWAHQRSSVAPVTRPRDGMRHFDQLASLTRQQAALVGQVRSLLTTQAETYKRIQAETKARQTVPTTPRATATFLR